MHAEHCGVGRELVPADQQLAEIRIIHVVGHEAADVGRPPRNAGKAHVQAALQLVGKRLERRGHVARPHDIAVLLATRPGAAQKVDRRLAALAHLVPEDAAVHLRVHVAARERRARAVTVILKIIHAVVWLGVVEPERVDSQVGVILLADLPDVLARRRVERIDLHTVALIVVRLLRAALGADQKPQLRHRVEVLALAVHGRPHGHHHLDAHLMQLVDHRLHIRPVRLVKLPVALQRPVEEINHDAVNLDALRLVPARYLQDLILRAVAEFALPQTHQIFRKMRRSSTHARVRRQNFLRRVRHGDPIVHLLRRARVPLRDVLAERHAADRGVVPEHAVAERRHHERNADLGVALRELERAPLQIEVRLLVLPHAVDLLAVVALEKHLKFIFTAAGNTLPLAVYDFQAAALTGERAAVAAVVLAQDQLVIPVERQYTRKIHRRFHAPVHDLRARISVLRTANRHDRCRRRNIFRERPCHIGNLRLHRRPYAQGVLSPALDPQSLTLALCQKSTVFYVKYHLFSSCVTDKVPEPFRQCIARIGNDCILCSHKSTNSENSQW